MRTFIPWVEQTTPIAVLHILPPPSLVHLPDWPSR
jgi:hypothetical protein